MNVYQGGILWWCKFYCILQFKWSMKYLARASLMHFTDEAPKHKIKKVVHTYYVRCSEISSTYVISESTPRYSNPLSLPQGIRLLSLLLSLSRLRIWWALYGAKSLDCHAVWFRVRRPQKMEIIGDWLLTALFLASCLGSDCALCHRPRRIADSYSRVCM